MKSDSVPFKIFLTATVRVRKTNVKAGNAGGKKANNNGNKNNGKPNNRRRRNSNNGEKKGKASQEDLDKEMDTCKQFSTLSILS